MHSKLNGFAAGFGSSLLTIQSDLLNSEVGKLIAAGLVSLLSQVVLKWLDKKITARKEKQKAKTI